MKRFLWPLALAAITMSLVGTACNQSGTSATQVPNLSTVPAASNTTPAKTTPGQSATQTSGEKPQYGGTVTLLLTADQQYWSMFDFFASSGPLNLTNEKLQDGDWTKGIAGGYGTKEATWDASTDIPELKRGVLAEEPLSWTIDAKSGQATVVMKIRQGVHWALNPKSAASRAVNGREFTADDVVHSINYRLTNPKSFMWHFTPELRNLTGQKTGPWEVTFKMPATSLLMGIQRLFDAGVIQPPELDKFNYGHDWKDSVGTGPFILTDYVQGSSATLVKNPNYWDKDPIGPGKGNQLPYVDEVKYLIIPDPSTQLTALRTGKLDVLHNLTPGTADELRRTDPQLVNAQRGTGQIDPIFMKTDKKPFDDVRVRRALMIATDFQSINKALYGGKAELMSWPYWYEKPYADLYLGLNDPDTPAIVKDLYTYDPKKAKGLLDQAGYPTGFKTDLILQSTQTDYYSAIAEMWSKVGINVSLKVTDPTVINSTRFNYGYQQMITSPTSPPSAFRLLATMYGKIVNYSVVDDPVVNKAYQKINLAAVTDLHGAMKMTRDLAKYAAGQAWVYPTPRYPTYTFWSPWLKNYSGEYTVGYNAGDSWTKWVWVDQKLKQQMGH